MSDPFFSVVVPVLDGGAVFERCLEALRSSDFEDYELVVVDDGSRDASADVARRYGARVLSTTGRTGPARARNLGAREANGEYLLFLDADCEVADDTLERAAAILRSEPELAALFGSYDADPAARSLVSRYKNLQHHWVHQRGRSEASTFWAGCGVVRRDVFAELGGFDAELYDRPSIEDIELGYRLRAAGHTIRLAKDVRVKHHKRWTLGSLVRTDFLDRGLPWTRLMLSRSRLEDDLNLGVTERASGVAAWLLLASLVAAAFERRSLLVAAACALFLLVANRSFYLFLARRGGLLFALGAVPLHWLYYLYSVLAFAIGLAEHLVSRLRA